ncbi:MAG: lipopolysaccharide biosynthesis protein [Planctomycetota bacterium]
MAGLSGKVLRSLGWVFANMATKNVLQFVRTVVLWRILSEDDFGLNGLAWLAINGFALLQDMGFQSALIQRKTDLDKAVSVTWYANVAIRGVVYAVLFSIAPAVAAHFREPEVCPILRVASLTVLANSFGSANEALLRKNFQFERILVVDSLELLVQVAIQIVLALLGFGVWSLVYGTLASAIVRSLLLWRIAPIRLVRFDPAVAWQMFHFGKHMTLSTLLVWCINNMDYYFVGKFLGKAALGFYTLAYKLAFLLSANVAKGLGAVLFPAFSEIGDDRDRVRAAWLKSIRYSMAVMVPMALGMILFSRQIIATFYKPKCDVIVATFSILTVAALFRGVGVPIGDLQKGIGRPHLLTTVAFAHVLAVAPILGLVTALAAPATRALLRSAGLVPIEGAIAWTLVYPLHLRVSLAAASVAITGTTFFAGLGFALVLTSRHVGYTARQVLGALAPSLASGGVMAAAALGAKAAFAIFAPSAPAPVVLFVGGPTAAAAYAVTMLAGFPSVYGDLRALLARSRPRPAVREGGEAAAWVP